MEWIELQTIFPNNLNKPIKSNQVITIFTKDREIFTIHYEHIREFLPSMEKSLNGYYYCNLESELFYPIIFYHKNKQNISNIVSELSSYDKKFLQELKKKVKNLKIEHMVSIIENIL